MPCKVATGTKIAVQSAGAAAGDGPAAGGVAAGGGRPEDAAAEWSQFTVRAGCLEQMQQAVLQVDAVYREHQLRQVIRFIVLEDSLYLLHGLWND